MSTLSSVIIEGLSTAMPSPSIAGRLYFTTDTQQTFYDTGTAWDNVSSAGGSGTVTSVGLAVPSRQTVTGSPVTGSGTLTIADNAQAANQVFAGPASGSSATPAFRALRAADLPVATTSEPGAVQPDGTTITISDGVISASGGSGTSVDILSEQKPSGTLYSNKGEYVAVTAGETVTLLNQSGYGYVESILFASEVQANVGTGTINIYVNGDSTPNISMPLEQFFESVYMSGSASPNNVFANRFVGFNSASATENSMFSLIPIPYSNGIVITVTLPDADTIFYTLSGQSNVANSWPYTRKFWAQGAEIDAPAMNSTETFLNFAGPNKGRFLGLWMLSDGYPHSMSPYGADLEGNFRIYIDCFNSMWAASTAFTAGQTLIDSNGNLQTVTTAGTTGSSMPTSWGIVTGATTTDGTVTWTCTVGDPPNIWRASKSYTVGMSVLDTNGNVQTVTTAGTTGASAPTWATSGTTADRTVEWTCSLGATRCKAAYQSSGTEDYFLFGFYGGGVPGGFSAGGGSIGRTFVSPTAAQTESFYRFHLNDPIRFNNAIAVLKQTGDSSEVSYTGSPRIWYTPYFYTEDTN